MTSAIAILTYNRLHALQETLKGLKEHCGHYPIGIFDDCGQKDGTESFLKKSGPTGQYRADLLATCHQADHIGENVHAFLGQCNLGVAGNSNRALKWLYETGCDHLILMNDDLHVLGDFVNFYNKGHTDLNVGMFSFCDFTHHSSYRWLTVHSRGYQVKLCPRMTGIMLSMKRAVLDKVGYFDARFGKFGEEHCDFMNRARLCRFLDLDGQMQPQIDLDHTPPLLRHQDVDTSVTGLERAAADREASAVMAYVASRYGVDPVYRPFCLRLPKQAGGYGSLGIQVNSMSHYELIDAPV